MKTCLPQLLESTGWTRSEFAALVGVDNSQVSRWMSGSKTPSKAAEAGFRAMLACSEAGRFDLAVAGIKLEDLGPSRKSTTDKSKLQILVNLIIATVEAADAIDPEAQVSPGMFEEAIRNLQRAKDILSLYGKTKPQTPSNTT